MIGKGPLDVKQELLHKPAKSDEHISFSISANFTIFVRLYPYMALTFYHNPANCLIGVTRMAT